MGTYQEHRVNLRVVLETLEARVVGKAPSTEPTADCIGTISLLGRGATRHDETAD